jgi:hypothetical protein
MSESARIDSIDALKILRTFLCNFAKKISVAVDEADFDIQDALNWLENDRYPFWKDEVRRRNELLVKAKLELKRKQIMERAIGGHDSCIDEIRAFAAAQKRFDEAQEKLKKTQSWILNLEKECFDCRGTLQSLANFIRIDLVNYRTKIDHMICSLESYVSVSAPMTALSEMPADKNYGDEMLSAARTTQYIQPQIGELENLCKNLRSRNPLKNVADIPTESPISGELKDLTINMDILEILKNNRKRASLEEPLAFDQPVQLSEYIYCERLAAGENRGFAGYIGHVESEKTKRISACTVADMLKDYPSMEAILFLPVGWMALIKKNRVEAVFNADNKLMIGGQPSNKS